MKNLGICAVLFAASLWAADFWQSKAFTDWSDKDVRKMLDASPWSKEVSVAIGDGQAQSAGSTGRKSGRTPGSMGEADPNAPADPASGDQPGKPGGRAAKAESAEGLTIPTTTLVVRWQSARPIKEALARMKYGSEASTSKDAKLLIETVEPNYIIVVSGLMKSLFKEDGSSQKAAIISASELLVKGKDPVKPVDFMIQPNGRLMDAYFAFPKTTEFSLDDKEIEFSTKFQTVIVKQRFQLKSMVVNGKLEL